MNSFHTVPRKIKIAFLLLIIIAVSALAFSFFLWQRTNDVRNRVEGPKVEEVVKEVGKVLVLPQNETPTLATVTDLRELRNQPFFARAEIGDYVLIYPNSRRAILWRPTTKQVVEVTAVNPTLGDASTESEIQEE